MYFNSDEASYENRLGQEWVTQRLIFKTVQFSGPEPKN